MAFRCVVVASSHTLGLLGDPFGELGRMENLYAGAPRPHERRNLFQPGYFIRYDDAVARCSQVPEIVEKRAAFGSVRLLLQPSVHLIQEPVLA